MTKPVPNPLPGWVPDTARLYLEHVVDGVSIRALARRSDSHASTVMRQVRRCELLRDDPLIDLALKRLGHQRAGGNASVSVSGAANVNMTLIEASPTAEVMDSEARRILRRLAEPGACLAVAQGMEKAVVVRETADGQTHRTGVVDTSVAEAMALKGWIAASGNGKVARYHICPAGRIALKDLLAEVEAKTGASKDADPRGARYGTVESPLMMLARRRDKDGSLFLSEDLVRAGERLREDFELAQMSPETSDNWDEMMAEIDVPDLDQTDIHGPGTEPAKARVRAVIQDLGPGLGDVVLRACCLLEGMEAIEKRMGWAARSGKIVLRIGLQRLSRHYQKTQGRLGPMIG